MSSKKLVPANRVKDTEESVWVEFVRLVGEHKPVNLGQGFPDFGVPDYIPKALANATLSHNLLNQYTRGFGHPRLVSVLSKFYSRLINREINPLKEILVTIGAYQALYCSILGNINPGDEVIIIEPFYDCYEPMVLMAGGIPVCIPLRPRVTENVMTSDDWVLEPEELAGKFNEKTKAIIVNNPNNPLGKVFRKNELELIAKLAKQWDTLVIMDEVYEWMVYKGKEHVRMASLPGMWERTITVGSAGKTFSVTGWKLGWAYGPSYLISNLQALHQNNVYTCPTPIQEAVAVGFELEIDRVGKPECYFSQMPVMLQPKRDEMARILEESGLRPVIPEGGYFMLADYSKIGTTRIPNFIKIGKGWAEACVDLTWNEMDAVVQFDDGGNKPKDNKFCKWMIKERKLAAIPPSSFYGTQNKCLAENYIRLCFFKNDETLEAAEKILRQLKVT